MSAADSLQVQNQSNYTAPQIPTNRNGPIQKVDGKVGKDHTLNAAVCAYTQYFYVTLSYQKQTKITHCRSFRSIPDVILNTSIFLWTQCNPC